MKGWTPQAAERLSSPLNPSPKRPASPQQGKTPPAPPSAPVSEETDEDATLPEGPQLGRWQIGSFDVRTTTAYAPNIRLVATGPATDWPRFLAHLQAYQP